MPIQTVVSDRSGLYQRAWYGAAIAQFQIEQPTAVLGRMVESTEFDLLQAQRDAWIEQTRLLQAQVKGLAGAIFLEFSIPRMGRRIDAVLIIGSIIFVIEFKVGETAFDRGSVEQVWDYALDLKNFGKGALDLRNRNPSF